MNLFGSIFTTSVTVKEFLIATVASMLIGFIIAFYHMYRNEQPGSSMAISLVLLPGIITVAMMLVNGNIGTGLAVAGVFNLVRFRSIKANAKELSCIFSSMVVGLCCGVGYVFIALCFAIIIAAAGIFLETIRFGEKRKKRKILKITVPESLDYEEMFDDILNEYASKNKLQTVKTTAMGSLYKLTYELEMKPGKSSKEFIDKLRERNGNLEISLSMPVTEEERI